MFTDSEREYIGSEIEPGQAGLARIATSTLEGHPHVVPLRARLNQAGDKVIVSGSQMVHSFKYRQVQRNPWVAIVWDTEHTGPPRAIKGIEVRGTAVIRQGTGDGSAVLEVTPIKVFSWGINEHAADSFEKKMGMKVVHLRQAADAEAKQGRRS